MKMTFTLETEDLDDMKRNMQIAFECDQDRKFTILQIAVMRGALMRLLDEIPQVGENN